jgi:drug/metabolite transporter (DMT)-like permease
MSGLVTSAVLAAAILHATWNALVKSDGDRMILLGGMVAVEALICLALLSFFPLPPVSAIPFLIASALLHSTYKLFLLRAYSLGDLSQVYPIARGSAPLLVALFAALFAGEALTLETVGGVAIIAVGIMSLSFLSGGFARSGRGMLAASLATGTMIAAYTVVDGSGARHLGSPHVFMIWATILDAAIFLPAVILLRKDAVRRMLRRWRPATLAGGITLGAYWLVVWALTQAPMASVSALRETSVIFGALIGSLLFKEPQGRRRVLAATLVAAGVVLLRP